MTRLHELLDASLRLPCEYHAGLTNHLPMALQALAALGAGDAQLDAFFQVYARRFDNGAQETLAGFGAARERWAAQIEAHRAEATLRDALPTLWPGFAAAAFHGPIRAAHAVASGHAGELAAALAYWTVRARPLPAPRSGGAALDFDAWFDALEAAALDFESSQRLISERMQQAAETEAYHGLAGALAVPADASMRLERRAAALYAHSGNFTVLHLVTGARAARVLSGAAGQAAPAVIWPAFAAGVIASGLRARNAAPTTPAGWPQVVAAAIASDDDHRIKLVHACVEHSANDPGRDEYLQAARRALAA